MALSISEQLQPLQQRMRRSSPLVRPVVSVTARIEGSDKGAVVQGARQKILKWLQARVGTLPPEAWAMEPFEHMTPGRFAAGVKVAVPDGEYWAVRCDDPDKVVPGRTWTTEAAVARKGDLASFGVRLVVATSETSPQYVSSVPGIVRQMVDAPGLSRNGRLLKSDPLFVSDQDSLDAFLNLLLDPRRKNPVFAVSLGEREEDATTATIDGRNLAIRTLGIAHVAIITGPMAFGLSDTVGKSLSVFRGAVRTYRPGMTLDDDPFRHPLSIPQQIDSRAGGREAFSNMLIEVAARNSISATDEAIDLPPFTKAKQVALHQQRNEARGDQDYPALLALAEEELNEKQREIEALESLLNESEAKRQLAEDRQDELVGTNQFLRSRVVALEDRSSDSIAVDPPFPADFASMTDWAEVNLPGRVKITGRAQRDAKDSRFQDIFLVYSCLLYLGREFWTLKTSGGREAIEANESKLAALGIRNEPCGAEHLLRERGDTFLIQWGPNNRKQLLEMHLKNGGNTRDPTRCLRIYYFWDEDTQQVVVGSLPGHLETRAS